MSGDSSVVLSTTTENSICEHCGKEFQVGDSIRMTRDARINQCVHWPVLEQVISND